MFAVPGWSVSADTLQSEKTSSNNSAPAKSSRKRKRGGASAEEAVTSSNVADLYESVVEGKKSGPAKQGKEAKRQKNGNDGKAKKDNAEGKTEKPDVKAGGDDGAAQTDPAKQEKKEKKKKNKKPKQEAESSQGDDKDSKAVAASKPEAPVAAQLPPPPKLTPLQASMREKLVSARFRHLNETLYTRPSEEAFQLFQESPEMFGEYHEGFRRQVKVWPENPVDSFLRDIRGRSKVKPPSRSHKGPAPTQLSKTTLPRTTGTCTIADLGCGDARLAESMEADKAKLRVEIKSYDLQSPSPLVIKADIANLPLADGSVNVAVFCLALMGTNWLDFIEEAFRILHWKGELWIAEIKSRFGPVRSKNAPVDHSVGNRRKPIKKGKAGPDDGANDNDLAVEVDGAEDRRRETDVSAFVEALKSRGFVLQGERNEAIDASNKMFVKMHFIKGTSPTKGKGAKPQDAAPRGKKAYAPKWDDGKDENKNEVNEAAILKPCVYKIR